MANVPQTHWALTIREFQVPHNSNPFVMIWRKKIYVWWRRRFRCTELQMKTNKTKCANTATYTHRMSKSRFLTFRRLIDYMYIVQCICFMLCCTNFCQAARFEFNANILKLRISNRKKKKKWWNEIIDWMTQSSNFDIEPSAPFYWIWILKHIIWSNIHNTHGNSWNAANTDDDIDHADG